MRIARIPPWRGLAVAAAVLLAAGCAGAPPAARESGVTVLKIERVRWDLPAETGVFRVHFDPAVSLEIRREAERLAAAGNVDYYYAEIQILVQETERELRARGLCSGSVVIASPVESGAGVAGTSAIFKCRPPLID